MIGIDGDQVVGLFGARWHDGPTPASSASPVATGSGGCPVAHVTRGVRDGPTDLESGIYVIEADGTFAEGVTDREFQDAQMWSFGPSAPAVPERIERP